MGERYDQSDLNIYGAEDDHEMDLILDALERANKGNDPPAPAPAPSRSVNPSLPS
jgi:hypothetical protein